MGSSRPRPKRLSKKLTYGALPTFWIEPSDNAPLTLEMRIQHGRIQACQPCCRDERMAASRFAVASGQ